MNADAWDEWGSGRLETHLESRHSCAHSTISRFRGRYTDQVVGLLGQSLLLCAASGLVNLGVVSIDGTG